MWFWPILAAVTALVALSLLAGLRPARARGGAVTTAASDMAVYRDQLREVDRDLERGTITEAEAQTLRLEVSRRLLDADRRAQGDAGADAERARPRAAGLLVVVAMLGAAGLYAMIGAPGYPDQPLDARLAAARDLSAARPDQASAERAAAALSLPAPAEPDFLALMDQLRAALQARPDDPQGLRLLARNEARLGRYAEARAAQARLVEVLGESATIDDRAALLDVTVAAAGGVVTTDADALIADILARQPGHGTATYYAGLGQAQIGRADRAFPLWRRLWEDSPDGAPWLQVLETELPLVAREAGVRYDMPARRGPSAGDIAAASEMSAEDRAQMIRGMVDGLSERLATEGGPPSDWARLIVALGVLGETPRARAIAAEAHQVFAGDAGAIAAIEAAEARLP